MSLRPVSYTHLDVYKRQFLNVAQGETLSNKLVRAGRAMQAGVYFVTQSSGDVAKESLKNNIGLKFAFRSTDLGEIKQTLEFFGIDKDDENNQKRLRDLDNGQCLLQDLYGRVAVSYTHLVWFRREKAVFPEAYQGAWLL